MLTVFGLVGALLVFLGYWATNLSPTFLFVASVGVAMNWIGDSLDGTLARFRKAERPRYGFFVDHTADLLSQILVGLGLALTVYIKTPLVLLLLSAYLAFVAYTFIRARVFEVVQIAYFAVGPTEVRSVLIFMNVIIFFFPDTSHDLGTLGVSMIDIVCIVITVTSYGGLLIQIFRDWRLLVGEESSSAKAAADSIMARRQRPEESLAP